MRLYSIYVKGNYYICDVVAKDERNAREIARKQFPAWKVGFIARKA